MKNRLAIIDLLGLRKGHNNILIEKSRIVSRRVDVSAADKDAPWARTKEPFARRGREGRGKASVGSSGHGGDEVGVKLPVGFNPIHNFVALLQIA